MSHLGFCRATLSRDEIVACDCARCNCSKSHNEYGFYSDSDDDTLARSSVLLSSVANQKRNLIVRAEEWKIWEDFHNLRTRFVKEGRKWGKVVQKPHLLMRFVANTTRAVTYKIAGVTSVLGFQTWGGPTPRGSSSLSRACPPNFCRTAFVRLAQNQWAYKAKDGRSGMNPLASLHWCQRCPSSTC